MAGPLIPHTQQEARDLFSMIMRDLEGFGPSNLPALQLVALECTAHLAGALSLTPPGPRSLVLHGCDPSSSLGLARAAVAAMPGLPSVEIPVTMCSEAGWAGRSLPDWVGGLSADDKAWASRGVVLLVGLDAVRMRRGTYTVAAGSGSTEDYRRGKSENIAAMIAGQPIPLDRNSSTWDARHAMVIVTAGYDSPSHDSQSLYEWGLERDLAAVLGTATWVRIDAAEVTVAARDVRRHCASLERLYALLGYSLALTPEAVEWAASHAEQRGGSAATAAAWIAHTARLRLARLLESPSATGTTITPDDLDIPPSGPAVWND
jgi:hypothetical protein